jgi:hypothetical protein
MKMKSVLILIVSLATFLAAAEGLLRMFPSGLPEEVKVLRFLEYDEVFKLKINPNFHETVSYPEYTFRLDTTDLGLGGIGFRDDGLDKEETLAVVVGDSFVFGLGVDLQEVWTEIVEKEVGKDVVNMGTPTHGTINEYLVLKDYGMKIDSEYVVLMFFQNDITDNYGYLNSGDQRLKRLVKSSYLADSISAYIGRLTAKRGDIEEYEIYGNKFYMVPNLWKINDQYQVGLEEFKSNLEKIRSLAESDDRKFLVVVMPPKEEVYYGLIEARHGSEKWSDIKKRSEDVSDVCLSGGYDCIYLADEIRKSDAPVYYKYDGHLNEAGNRLVAQALIKALEGR